MSVKNGTAYWEAYKAQTQSLNLTGNRCNNL